MVSRFFSYNLALPLSNFLSYRPLRIFGPDILAFSLGSHLQVKLTKHPLLIGSLSLLLLNTSMKCACTLWSQVLIQVIKALPVHGLLCIACQPI